MNQEVKAIWTAALRSGKYEQSGLHLRTRDGYCCLGVLCELGVRAGIIPAGQWDEAGFMRYGREQDGELLPGAISQWAGLAGSDPQNPVVSYDDGRCGLAELNDDEKLDFAAIADLIDASL